MRLQYQLKMRDGSEETILCAGMKCSDDTVAFYTLTQAVNAQGQAGGEVFLILHWSDIREIRKIEVQNGEPHLALAT